MLCGSSAKRLDDDFGFDPGLTMASASRSSQQTYENFWKEYYARPRSTWENDIQKRIADLMKLPDNWDGYNSPRLREDVVNFAWTVMKQLMHPQAPSPQVVPSSGGGLQLEWHEKDIDLEVNFTETYRCELWVDDHRTGTCVTKMLTNEFPDLENAILLLTTR